MYGFILNVLGLLYTVFSFGYAATKTECWANLANLVSCPYGAGGIAWFVTGMVLRWRFTGKVCSGAFLRDSIEDGTETVIEIGDAPYQWKSGRFMNIYLLISLISIPVTCLLVCLGVCIFGAIMKSRG